MPPSQLKRLKASLREQGLAGGQKSKKQKKQDTGRNVDQRVQRQAALQSIRDSFNPFEVKKSARPAKFQSTSRDAKPASVARPGVTRSMGEEARRATLLPEIQRRNKTGGIIDRRIGENDPTMTPEERALQRFAREKQRKKGGGLFDLEEADDGEDFLTHGGKTLTFDGAKDDFDMSGISADDDDDDDDQDRPLKRRRPSANDEDDDQDEDMSGAEQDGDQPARKKTKAEVMKEVIAKSKLHKYERQKAKEDDDDLREELDQGLQEMLDLLRGHKPPPKPKQVDRPENDSNGMNPERLAMIQGKSDAEKDYDMRLKQMALDKRAAPTERTKTEEEVAAQEAQRLKELEESRLRRMQGQESEDDDDDDVRAKSTKAPAGADATSADEDFRDDAAEFGLPNQLPPDEPLVLEDEDEFLLENDMVASGSDVDMSEGSGESDSDSDESDDEAENRDVHEDEEDEFVRGILGPKDEGDSAAAKKAPAVPEPATGLAYTYACPRSHEDLLDTFSEIAVDNVPTVVQRIRALYHPSLSAENKEKLADFSVALIQHISYMADEKQPLRVIETLIRHVHSLSRTYPETIANAFRKHLAAFHERGTPTAGDLVILTAIGTIYPTSDHFHQVVTPAITLMARWLEMTAPTTPSTLATGAFIVALCVKYQQLSKRYIPEAVRFTTKALQSRLSSEQLTPHVANLVSMADLWSSKSSFTEIFSPAALHALQQQHHHHKSARAPARRLLILLQQAKLVRRPLALHNHKPLAIRTSIPKFEDNFNPDKHYDPDQERSEASKLRKEYKREKKGAVRELRKDANFVAREQLREKKERDAEYEKKYKRLVAEIQGEEGHESKAYEREKRMRKSKR